jgi:Phospholipase_D-nuclease N-terminal
VVSGTRPAQRIAERLIRSACSRLPADARAERFREWTAELPAILDDESIRPSWRRDLRALAFCVGISRAARRLGRPTPAGSRPRRNSRWRSGAPRTRPSDTVLRVAVGFGVYAVVVAAVVTVLATRPNAHGWPLLLVVAAGVGFNGYCLVDIARASQVRHLPKWAWALICLAQTPAGGIVYLCAGRVGRAQSAPPGPAPRP